MSLFNWSDKYSVGVHVFDTQHKTFVALINELHDSMRAGNARDALGGILKRLLEYARMHFADEERQMTLFSYPDLACHKAAHDKLLVQIIELKAKFDGGANAITIEVVNFLKDWLINHTLLADKKYTVFFNDRGVV
ncbi:MAG: hypothetical protein A3J24_07905 [Deltaproteobacteria bacterium RIFCSPLOWO2_02_FULL_53_8]|nr:MAG: hypothetical protein A3J24_07905 [Deltaproteobacteria bacterium RIFCSPLOWO2_02_FULL_53_8]